MHRSEKKKKKKKGGGEEIISVQELYQTAEKYKNIYKFRSFKICTEQKP